MILALFWLVGSDVLLFFPWLLLVETVMFRHCFDDCVYYLFSAYLTTYLYSAMRNWIVVDLCNYETLPFNVTLEGLVVP